MAIDTLGGWHPEALDILSWLGRPLASKAQMKLQF